MSATRYKELGYHKESTGWRFNDTETGAAIGPLYPTKIELLCDLERFYQSRFGTVEVEQ